MFKLKTLKVFVVLSVLVFAGCASTYKYIDLQTLSAKLDPAIGVLISVPEDGWYENTQYRNSGRMTAKAIRAAFSKNAKKVDIISSCTGDDCLNEIDPEKYGYYVKPIILGWEERATEWSAKPDKIEIQIVVFNSKTKEELANSSYTGKSKLATFGGDHPQDLLPEPTSQYVNSLYH